MEGCKLIGYLAHNNIPIVEFTQYSVWGCEPCNSWVWYDVNNGNLYCTNFQQNCSSRHIDASLQNKNGTKSQKLLFWALWLQLFGFYQKGSIQKGVKHYVTTWIIPDVKIEEISTKMNGAIVHPIVNRLNSGVDFRMLLRGQVGPCAF